MGWIARRRSRRDARAAQELAAFQSFAAANGASIVAVDSVYQVGRRGSKALVRTGGSPFQRDAWFWWTRVRPGSLAAVYMGEGWGSHSGRGNVLYIGSRSGHGVLATVDAGTCVRASRYAANSGDLTAAPPLLVQPPRTLSAGRIARRTILITVLTCMAPLSVLYYIGRDGESRREANLDSALRSTCSYSAGTTRAHALTETGPRPVHLIETSTVRYAGNDLREQLTASGASADAWRPKRVGEVQLVACVSGLGDGDLVKEVSCVSNANAADGWSRRLALRNGKYHITVHEARTGRSIASIDLDGEAFPFDALNDDTTQLCGAAPATVDPGRRGVLLSTVSVAQVHQVVDPFITGPKQ